MKPRVAFQGDILEDLLKLGLCAAFRSAMLFECKIQMHRL